MSSGTENLSKVERLKKQRSVLNARIQKMEATQKQRGRKQDTRRKILVGAYYLEQVKKEDTIDELVKCLDKFLVRNHDRRLFGLKELVQDVQQDEKVGVD